MRASKPTYVVAEDPHFWAWRVFLDGEDVSARCFWADTKLGAVGLYVEDEVGKTVYEFDPYRPAIEFKRGTVTLEPPRLCE